MAPIRPLAWEPPNAAGAALKKKDKRKGKFGLIFVFVMVGFTAVLW